MPKHSYGGLPNSASFLRSGHTDRGGSGQVRRLDCAQRADRPPYTLIGALVYWLWEETYVQEVMGSNPSTGYRMDIFTLNCCKKCNFCLKKTKNKQKNIKKQFRFNPIISTGNGKCHDLPRLPSTYHLSTLSRLANKQSHLVAKRRPNRQRIRRDRSGQVAKHDEGGGAEEGGCSIGVHLHREQQQRHAAHHEHSQDFTQP